MELASADDRLPGCPGKEDRALGEVAPGVPPRAADFARRVVVDDDRGSQQHRVGGDDESVGLLGDRDLTVSHLDGAVQLELDHLARGVALGVPGESADADLGPALAARVAVHLGLRVQDDLAGLGGDSGGLRLRRLGRGGRSGGRRRGCGGRCGRRSRGLGRRAGHAARGAGLCRSAGV